MNKIIIYIEGGNFAGAVANGPDVELMVVDYDNEAGAEHLELREFQKIAVDPVLIDHTISGTEGASR